MVEDLPVAAVDVVEGLDESGVDRSLDGHSTGSPFALTQCSTVSGFTAFHFFINTVNSNWQLITVWVL